MDTDSSPEIIEIKGQLMDLGKLFQRGANTQGPVNLGLGHFQADARQVIAQLRKCQMAVGIDKHETTQPMSGSTPARLVLAPIGKLNCLG
jgi:hypothetical protein